MSVAFLNAWSAARTLILVIGLAAALSRWLQQWVKNTSHKKEVAREFKLFASKHGCRPTSRPLNYNWVLSLLNKAKLFANRRTEMLAGIFRTRFSEHGPTHALYDSHGIPKVIHTIDPENVKAMASSKSADYSIPDSRKVAIGPIGGRGVVMTEGNEWADNRKIINMGFRGAKYGKGLDMAVDMLIHNLNAHVDANGWTRLCVVFDQFANMSLDRSTAHMFGVGSGLQASVASLQNQDDRLEKHVHVKWKQTTETLAKYVLVRSLLGKSAWLWDSFTFRSACAELKRLCDLVIQDAVKNVKRGWDDDASFVGNLVTETSDVVRIRNIVLDLFIAGHNMTAGVLTWAFFELERHPDVFKEVRDEVIDRFGTLAEPKADMDWVSLQRCKKLSNVINETMRLYPTLPNLGRQAICNTVLPTGGGPEGKDPVAVAKGTVVMSCLYLMHRRQEEWQADAEEFKPERCTPCPKFKVRYPGEMFKVVLTLNKGKITPSAPSMLLLAVAHGFVLAAFALVELFYVIARLMQHFKALRVPAGAPRVKTLGAGLLLPPAEAALQFQNA